MFKFLNSNLTPSPIHTVYVKNNIAAITFLTGNFDRTGCCKSLFFSTFTQGANEY